jgi:aspartate kinase
MKFGGTSVQDSAAFNRVAEIVFTRRQVRPVVVVSAMSRVTNALLAAFDSAAAGDASGALKSLDEHFERHRAVSKDLVEGPGRVRFENRLGESIESLRGLLTSAAVVRHRWPALQDAIVAHGELLSSFLMAEVLQSQGEAAQFIDARTCIITDDEFGSATPLPDITSDRITSLLSPLIDRGGVPVLGGFIASSSEGPTTTLGRGGSDYSAAIIGAALCASEIQIWTDVSGVLTADPRIVKAAKAIPRLSYEEAAELAYFGAKVLHPKTIQPAVEKRIPVRICNSHVPEDAGTLVVAEPGSSGGNVKAIAHKTGVTTVQISSARMLGAYGFLRAIFEIFDKHKTVVDVVTTSEVSVSLSLDSPRGLDAIIRDLSEIGEVTIERERAIICVVGEGVRATPGIAAKIFSTLSEINISLISQGASRINVTFAVDEAEVSRAVTLLHTALFEK